MDIMVKVSDLKKMAQELESEGIEYVEISMMDAHEFQGETFPKSLNFMGNDGNGGGVDFEGIDHVEIDFCYKLNDNEY